MKVTLATLDEWLFKGLGGIVNMMWNRIKCDEPFSHNCKLMLDSELKRLGEVKYHVDTRQGPAAPAETPLSVIDTWFIKSYTGINNWLDTRTREGPPMDPSSLDDLQAHIYKVQEIIDRERAHQA